MNEDAKQMRELCQKWFVRLSDIQDPLNEKQTRDTILVLLDQMHKRLTILEGADLRSLEDISF